MNTQTEIERLEGILIRLRQEQNNCLHAWSAPYRDIEKGREPIYENRPMGSDFFNPVAIGMRETETPVWRRECSKCGLKQTTEKTEPVITGHRPVF